MADEINFRVNADTKNAEKSIDKLEKNVSGLQGIFGRASKGAKSFGQTLSSIGNTVKTGLGFGLILGALDAFKSTLGENQAVVDLFNQAMVVMQGVVNGVVEVLKPLFHWLSKAFKEPKVFWEELVTSFQNGAKWIKENMIDGVLNKFVQWANTAKIAILELRKNWNEFTGDTEEAQQISKEIEALQQENIKLAQENAKKMENIKGVVQDVVDFTSNALNTIRKSTQKAFDNKDVLANAEANIQKLQTLYQGIVEKYDLMAEKQRQIRDDESKTIDERIKANQELQNVLAEGEEKEKANIQARMGILQMQQNLLGYNKDRANELLALQQEITGVEAKYAGLRSEQLTNINSLEKEKIELTRSLAEGTIEANKIIMEANAELESDEMKKFALRKEALTAEYEARKKLLDEELAMQKEGTQAYVDSVNEKLALDAQYSADVKLLSKETADYQAEVDKESAQKRMETQEALASAVTGALSAISTAVGEETAVGKSLAVASAIIDTYMGANKALALGAGTPAGYINAAAIIATGLANVKKMVSTPIPGATDTTSVPSAGPSVSIVGGSADPSAQLARSLASQQQKPIKAYAVATDMTTQQAMDRRIQRNATFPG
jgi:hypothetical protein